MPSTSYQTRDLALAAYLYISGYEDFTCDREGDGDHNIVLCFDATPDMLELIRDYRDGMAEVEPREFARKYSLVRGRLLDFKHGRRVSV